MDASAHLTNKQDTGLESQENLQQNQGEGVNL